MKKKLSITIDAETVSLIESRLSDGLFRNRSHIIEYAVKRLLEER
ncbi:hypothetical protein ACFL0V_01315 [Nanoarchaeota archaeon]